MNANEGLRMSFRKEKGRLKKLSIFPSLFIIIISLQPPNSFFFFFFKRMNELRMRGRGTKREGEGGRIPSRP